MKNIAIILAGGSGTRFGGKTPKQFLKVAGKKIIEHTIEAFEQNSSIDEIAVVCNSLYVNLLEQIVVDNKYRKVKKYLCGGTERYESSLAAINAYTDDCNLIFHDAVRPLVSQRIIDDCVKALEDYEAIDVAVKTTDTIIQVSSDNLIDYIPDRSKLNNGQTPQCFRHGVIAKAYENALHDKNFKTTDDCGVVRKYLPEVPVFIVNGEQDNMKVTYEQDLFLLDKLFQLKKFDISEQAGKLKIADLKNTVTVVFGASYGIGKCISDKIQDLGGTVYGFSRSEGGVDVSDSLSVKNALSNVYKKENKINFIVNTAGVLDIQPLNSMEYKDIEKEISVNYKGAVIVAKESFEYLQQTKGCLLLFTSSSYTRGRMLYSIYSSTKAAVVNLTQALNEEWYNDGVRVNCICPERTKTPMRIKAFGNEPEDSLCSPEKVADFSISVLLSRISGEVIDVKR